MRQLLVWTVVMLLGCGSATRATSPANAGESARRGGPYEAVQCRVEVTTNGRRYQEQQRRTEMLTMIAGDTRTAENGATTLEARMFASSLRVIVKEANRQLFSADYGFGETLPANHYGPAGFTGPIFVSTPDHSGSYSFSCHSVPRSAYTDGPEDHTAQRETRAEVERSRLHKTLTETEACTLTRQQREAGKLCPPKHGLQDRVAALLALRRLRNRQFMDVTLEGANLEGADLRETYFQKVNFARANLKGAQLYACDFRFSRNLEGANLEGANLYSSQLLGANLRGANLERASLGSAELEHADLTGATLTGASLISADLDGANLSGADLSGAMLGRASLSGANLDGANLETARNLTQQQLDDAHGNAQTRLPPGLFLRRRSVAP